MTAPSSPEAPWPVRTVARKIADWIGRLGEVWVEGQVAQLSRRSGAATVFLTLRDPVADLVAYEESKQARPDYLRMLRNRLEKLEEQAVESSPLAPRGA